MIANVSASAWFKVQPKPKNLCPYTWKLTHPVLNRFPRRVIEAEYNDKEKCMFREHLYYHVLVKFHNER